MEPEQLATLVAVNIYMQEIWNLHWLRSALLKDGWLDNNGK